MKKSLLSHMGEKSASKYFKALIRETSVYEYYVELKEDALTEQGFFDLVKVPSLHVSGAGLFLKKLRRKKHLSQYKLAKFLNVSRSTLNSWENNYRNMLLQTLVRIVETYDVSRDTIYSLIDQGKFNTKIGLPVKFEKIREIVKHFSPHKYCIKGTISLIKCSKKTLSRIKATLNVMPWSSRKRIRSKELHNFLTTFFRYTRVPKINPPLTREVKLWYEKGIDLKRAMICPSLQSDGGIVQGRDGCRLRFHGKNKILHDYFVDAMYYIYNELPTSYFRYSSSEDCYITEYRRNSTKIIVDEIMKLAGNTKTKIAKGQTVDEYLAEPQPHLNYLINATEIEQQIALRIWASAEGFVTLQKDGGRVSPCLGIACSHPDLISQLQEIARRFNIDFTKRRSKRNWSGIDMIRSLALNVCINFLKLGGFIKGVKIGGNSKYHKGMSKNAYFLGILEFKIRQRTSRKLKNLSHEEIHNEINNIIKNKEYNPVDYYINYFSENETML